MTLGVFAPARLSAIGGDVGAGVVRAAQYARTLGRDAPSIHDRLRLGASAVVDEALLTTFQVLRSPATVDDVGPHLDEANLLVEHLWGCAAFARPEDFHVRPSPPQMHGATRRLGHLSFRHVAFASPYTPGDDVPAAARFREQTDNRIAHAWVLEHDEPRPWIVCVHGAGMGEPLADFVTFRAGALHRSGFNVALPVLPQHGPRGVGRVEVAFPTDDSALNLHGATQAIADVRAVIASAQASGAPVALIGVSLGAYVAATVAALEPDVRAVVLGVPVVDLSALLRIHAPARFAARSRFDEMCEVAHVLERITSPLAFAPPSTPVRRIFAGRADRLVRPEQVARLIDHWRVADPLWYRGGHIGFLGLAVVRRALGDALVDGGVARRDRGRVVALGDGAW